MSFIESMETFSCPDIYFRIKISIWRTKNDPTERNDEYVFSNDFQSTSVLSFHQHTLNRKCNNLKGFMLGHSREK